MFSATYEHIILRRCNTVLFDVDVVVFFGLNFWRIAAALIYVEKRSDYSQPNFSHTLTLRIVCEAILSIKYRMAHTNKKETRTRTLYSRPYRSSTYARDSFISCTIYLSISHREKLNSTGDILSSVVVSGEVLLCCWWLHSVFFFCVWLTLTGPVYTSRHIQTHAHKRMDLNTNENNLKRTTERPSNFFLLRPDSFSFQSIFVYLFSCGRWPSSIVMFLPLFFVLFHSHYFSPTPLPSPVFFSRQIGHFNGKWYRSEYVLFISMQFRADGIAV